MWVFENDTRLPVEDMKLIVPNGMVKLVIPIHNGLVGKYDGWTHHSKESSITLIGISDRPAIVDVEHDSRHVNIGIEFLPLGAYRMFHLNQSELRNRIFALEDVIGRPGRDLSEMVANVESIAGKINFIEQYLLKLLRKSEKDPILDYCLGEIGASMGLMAIGDLEKRTGYSSRWLYEKFISKVGLSPKNLSSVTRFIQFYEISANKPKPGFFRESIYNFFYDQAHFIKEFKRFTGTSPSRFIKSDNEFGHIFYRS